MMMAPQRRFGGCAGFGLMAAGCAAVAPPLFAQLGGARAPLGPRLRAAAQTSVGSSATSAAVHPSGTTSASATSATATANSAAGLATATAAAAGLVFAARSKARPMMARPAALAAAAAAAEPQPPAFDPVAQKGALAPLGFFDPLGFTKPGDEAGFRSLREAELKHGRVAMVASMGLLAQHFVKLPGFEQVPTGLASLTTMPGALGFLTIAIASGVFELGWRTDPFMEAGTFGDPLGLKVYTDDLYNRELSNGRFAMVSVLGILTAELVTGMDAVQQLGL